MTDAEIETKNSVKLEKPEKINRPPITEEKKHELDDKYSYPERMSHFTCYFGKYREKATFEEVAKDVGYCRYIMTLTPKTSNMHLFQRYYATLPQEESSEKKTVKKQRAKK
jgi:hypothetical protein